MRLYKTEDNVIPMPMVGPLSYYIRFDNFCLSQNTDGNAGGENHNIPCLNYPQRVCCDFGQLHHIIRVFSLVNSRR